MKEEGAERVCEVGGVDKGIPRVEIAEALGLGARELVSRGLKLVDSMHSHFTV